MPNPQDDYPAQEAEQRRDEILRNLLHMPPKQHKEIQAERKKQRKRRTQSSK